MGIEKSRDSLREHLAQEGWEKFDLYELTSRCFYYLSVYDPDLTLRDALEILRQIEIEWKIERKRNNERI